MKLEKKILLSASHWNGCQWPWPWNEKILSHRIHRWICTDGRKLLSSAVSRLFVGVTSPNSRLENCLSGVNTLHPPYLNIHAGLVRKIKLSHFIQLACWSYLPSSARWCRCPGCPSRPSGRPARASRPRTPPWSVWRGWPGWWCWSGPEWTGTLSWGSCWGWSLSPPGGRRRRRPALRIVSSSWTPDQSCCWSHSSGQRLSHYHWLEIGNCKRSLELLQCQTFNLEQNCLVFMILHSHGTHHFHLEFVSVIQYTLH